MTQQPVQQTTRPLGVLMLCSDFPPSPESGGLRAARFAKFFEADVQAEVLAPADWEAEGAAGWHNAHLLEEIRGRVRVHRTHPRRWMLAQPDDDRARPGNPPAAGFLGRLGASLMSSLVWVPDRQVAWSAGAFAAGRRLLQSGRFDVLYCGAAPLSLQRVALALKRVTGIPLVMDLPDTWLEHSGTPLEQRLQRDVVRQADALVVSTPAMRERVLSATPGLPPSKLHLIPDGYDPERRSPSASSTPAAADQAGPRQIVFAGHLTRELHVLVDALEVLSAADPKLPKQVHFRFLGPMDRRLKRQFRRVASPDLYDFGGAVPDEAWAASVSSAAAVVYALPPDGGHRVPQRFFEGLASDRLILAFLPRGYAWDLLAARGACRLVENIDAAHAVRELKVFVHDLVSGRLDAPPAAEASRLLAGHDARRLAEDLAQVLARTAG